MPKGATLKAEHYRAVGYVQAMHGLCIDCHARIAKRDGKPEFARCTACHRERRGVVDGPDLVRRPAVGTGILLPAVSR